MARDYRYGQHFLRSPRVVAELIGHSNIRKNDTVVDLGAGSGVISSVLTRRARQVIAVELEPEALQKLHTNLDQNETVTIVEQDIMEYELPDTPYKVFSNIPFHLSADVVRRVTHASHAPTSIYLIVQKQFAQKIVPSDRHFTSLLGAQLAPWWQARIRKPLRRTDFTPPPGVDTVLLELKPQPSELLSHEMREDYEAFVARCYEQQQYFRQLPTQAANINPERKPSELAPDDWVRLYRLVKSTE